MSNLELVQLFCSSKCLICGGDSQEFNVGRFYKLQEFSVHYLCLLTGFNLPQNGKPNEGLLGFLLCDIIKAFRNYCGWMCQICKRSGASLQCIACKRMYHLPCGLQNGVVIQMLDDFPSYCQQCIPKELIPVIKAPHGSCCSICLSSVFDGQRIYWPICCKPLEWMHVNCLQNYALMAGYKTKCPLCANKKKFRLSVRKYGIYIPNEDAAWLSDEPSPNQIYNLQCSAQACIVIDDVLRNTLVGCCICSDNLGHYECTFSGIFVCTDCTQQLWPEDYLNLLEKKRKCLQKDNKRALLLLSKNERVKTTFPWLLYVFSSVLHEKVSEKMIKDIIAMIEKELCTNQINRWYKILLTDENRNFILSKIKEYHESFLKNNEVNICLSRHPADEDLQEIEIEILRRGAGGSDPQPNCVVNTSQKLSGHSSKEPKEGRASIADQILKKIMEPHENYPSGSSGLKPPRLCNK